MLHREVDRLVNLLELPPKRGGQLEDQHLQHHLLLVPAAFRRVRSVPLFRGGLVITTLSLVDDEHVGVTAAAATIRLCFSIKQDGLVTSKPLPLARDFRSTISECVYVFKSLPCTIKHP